MNLGIIEGVIRITISILVGIGLNYILDNLNKRF